jgi:hypothetical protein
MIFVDGIPFATRFDDQNTAGDFLMGLSPQSVERIEVVTRANPLFGVNGTNGAIIIYTKNAVKPTAVPSTVGKNVETQTFKVRGYTPALTFKSVSYETGKMSDQKDARSTLYWNPSVKTNESGKSSFSFYSADNSSTYKVQVVGVTNDGSPFSKELFVKIEK